MKDDGEITKKAIRFQPARASRSVIPKPIIKKGSKSFVLFQILNLIAERKPDKLQEKDKKKATKKATKQKKQIAHKTPDATVSSSESDDEIIREKFKPALSLTKATKPIKSIDKEDSPAIQSTTVDSTPLKTSPATAVPNQIELKSSSSTLPLNSPVQSLLELQQMHHRQALAQQQLNFMLVLQQQLQAESDNAFRNLMQNMQQRD